MAIEEIEKLIETEKNLYVLAYQRGLSVAYICRALAFDNLERVYSVLRDRKQVPLLPTRQKYSIPPVLKGTFLKARHSFPKWCASHNLDLGKAEHAIKLGPYEGRDVYSIKVLNALKDDFHNLYEELYGSGNIFNFKYTDYDESGRSRFDCEIRWIDAEGQYLASIPELPDMLAYGDSWDSALTGLKLVFNVKRRIYKLEAMVEHGKKWKSAV